MLILGAPPVKILNRYILENLMQYSNFDFYTFSSLSFDNCSSCLLYWTSVQNMCSQYNLAIYLLDTFSWPL